jgi:hypothetical protein
MRLILQDEPVRVMASAGQAVNHLDERYGGETPDIWDHGYVIVDFAHGARAMLELCMFAEGSDYQEEIAAVGPTGKIQAFVPGPTRFWNFDIGPQPVPHLIVSPRHPDRAAAPRHPRRSATAGGGRPQRRHLLPAPPLPRCRPHRPHARGHAGGRRHGRAHGPRRAGGRADGQGREPLSMADAGSTSASTAGAPAVAWRSRSMADR